MARSFVLGIDCKAYFMVPGERVPYDSQSPDDARPKQLMTYPGGVPTYDTSASSSYSLLKTVQDVTLNLGAATADVTSRNSNGWRQMVSTLKEGSVDFTVLWEPDDVLFEQLLNVYLEQCPAAFAILDGPIEGFAADCSSGVTGSENDPYTTRCNECGIVTGLHADFVVTSFSRNETLEEGVTADVTLEPAEGQIYPEWLIIPQLEA